MSITNKIIQAFYRGEDGQRMVDRQTSVDYQAKCRGWQEGIDGKAKDKYKQREYDSTGQPLNHAAGYEKLMHLDNMPLKDMAEEHKFNEIFPMDKDIDPYDP